MIEYLSYEFLPVWLEDAFLGYSINILSDFLF